MIFIVTLLLALAPNSHAVSNCVVLVGFKTTALDSKKEEVNPSDVCASQLADPAKNIFQFPSINLTRRGHSKPRAVERALKSIRAEHPNCAIIGLGAYDYDFRMDPYVDAFDQPIPFVENGKTVQVLSFPLKYEVRAEISAYNHVAAMGRYRLKHEKPIAAHGSLTLTNPTWAEAVRHCADPVKQPLTLAGEDITSDADNACNLENYHLAMMKAGGFLHISKCDNPVLNELRPLIECLKNEFTPAL